jgi:hypothetical protein
VTARPPGLYPKHVTVLAAAADGVSLAEVGRRLGMPRTQVASRMSEAYRALDVGWLPREERRAAAVEALRGMGLIPAEATEGSVRLQEMPGPPEPR